MSWKEIKEKYPNAWNLWLKTSGNRFNEKSASEIINAVYHYRRLYDFFDEQGIFATSENIGTIEKPQFRSAVKDGHSIVGGTWVNPKGVPTRKEVEIEAFTKAFEIFEQNLTK